MSVCHKEMTAAFWPVSVNHQTWSEGWIYDIAVKCPFRTGGFGIDLIRVEHVTTNTMEVNRPTHTQEFRRQKFAHGINTSGRKEIPHIP